VGPTMSGLYLLILFGLTIGLSDNLVVRKNVVFQQLNKITTTRSRWLVTLTIDLNPFDQFLTKLSHDIWNVTAIAKYISKKYDRPDKTSFLKAFMGLEKELGIVKETHQTIKFSIHDQSER